MQRARQCTYRDARRYPAGSIANEFSLRTDLRRGSCSRELQLSHAWQNAAECHAGAARARTQEGILPRHEYMVILPRRGQKRAYAT